MVATNLRSCLKGAGAAAATKRRVWFQSDLVDVMTVNRSFVEVSEASVTRGRSCQSSAAVRREQSAPAGPQEPEEIDAPEDSAEAVPDTLAEEYLQWTRSTSWGTTLTPLIEDRPWCPGDLAETFHPRPRDGRVPGLKMQEATAAEVPHQRKSRAHQRRGFRRYPKVRRGKAAQEGQAEN